MRKSSVRLRRRMIAVLLLLKNVSINLQQRQKPKAPRFSNQIIEYEDCRCLTLGSVHDCSAFYSKNIQFRLIFLQFYGKRLEFMALQKIAIIFKKIVGCLFPQIETSFHQLGVLKRNSFNYH